MNNVASVAAIGPTGFGLILVGEGVVKVPLPECYTKPNIMDMDLLKGAFDYAFTIGNSITVAGAVLTVLSLYIAIRRLIKHDRRADDEA